MKISTIIQEKKSLANILWNTSMLFKIFQNNHKEIYKKLLSYGKKHYIVRTRNHR
jgi:hypothetical protein